MTAPQPPARPRAFRLDDPKVVLAERSPASRPTPQQAGAAIEPGAVVVEAQPDVFARPAAAVAGSRAEAAIEKAQQDGIAAPSRWGWGRLFWSALGALASLSLGLWVTATLEALFARSRELGWVGLVLVGLIAVALLGLLVREIVGVLRQSRIAALHKALAAARAADDRDAARRLVVDLTRLYTARPETAAARAEVDGLTREIVDGRDLIDVAERALMQPLDARARREIAGAAKRVSVVTAISPRAVLDVVFVAAQAVYIMRKIAEIYGGRPGLFGFFKLMRSVAAHIAITGSMAAGDSLLQQFLGHGIASRISTRLGEGVLNGLLTTRIGLSAMAVCRPMPFGAEKMPGVKDVAPFLFTSKKD